MKLKAEKRDKKYQKKNDVVLGVVYGGIDNVSITCKLSDFEKVYSELGTSGILELDIEGESHDVVIKDVQLDIASGNYYHIDFYAITAGQEMEATVNFEFIGEHSADKVGGMLNTSLNETHIKALPKNLPNNIEIDLGELKEVGDTIRLIDIKLPEGVSFVEGLDLESPIVSIVAAKSVADEEEANAGEVEITPDSNDDEKEGEESTQGDNKSE